MLYWHSIFMSNSVLDNSAIRVVVEGMFLMNDRGVMVNMVFVGTTRIAEMNFGFVRGLTEEARPFHSMVMD